ncbi:hypothetical protein LY78DRAFT_665067 [Colletotrichum sublineola]|nr:hypothetical protein LY78DRAFT_665067 [Colletotrichum sublineola]
MTKSMRGPSLPQARSYHHNHYHLHNKRAATPENAYHQHRQFDIAAPAPADAQPSTTPGPKIVVETVSVIQVVDASGLPIEVQTLYPTSAIVDAAATINAALDLTISAVLPLSSTGNSASQSSSTSSDATLSTPAATTPSSTSSTISQVTSLTSDPFSTTPAPSAPASSLYSSFSGQSNSTLFSTTTTLSSQISSDATSVSSSILSSLSSTSGSTSDSAWTSSGVSATSTFATSASSTLGSTATGTGAAGIIGGGGAAQPTAPSTSSGDSGSDNETTPTATVVGSVVGSLAGAAFLVVLVFLALRWKKSSGGRLRLSEASMGKRGILTGSSGPEGGGGGGMIQRSLSWGRSAAAVGPGAVVAARKHSRRASEPSETGERGFVRVSGRKLPSVLQSGGDGYTDPREGTMGVAPFGGAAGAADDDESVYYRDSRAFFDPGGPDGQSPRLALGSPMRPPPARDPIGRTLPSQDGSRDSRGSASRFQEQM